jgi:hypothetical protein
VAATSALTPTSAQELSAKTSGAETCKLGANYDYAETRDLDFENIPSGQIYESLSKKKKKKRKNSVRETPSLAGEAKRLSPEEEKRLRTRATGDGDGDVGVGGVVVDPSIPSQKQCKFACRWWCSGGVQVQGKLDSRSSAVLGWLYST